MADRGSFSTGTGVGVGGHVNTESLVVATYIVGNVLCIWRVPHSLYLKDYFRLFRKRVGALKALPKSV